MSQAKISKIENGVVIPSVDDVVRLAHALEASQEDVSDLVEQVEQLRGQLVQRRLSLQDLTTGQERLARDETAARNLATFQNVVMPGLLQTPEYAEAILTEYATVLSGGEPGSRAQIAPSAVAMRIQRQEVLHVPSKHFDFVIAENVLASPVGGPIAMLAQIHRLRTAGQLDNVTISILPTDAKVGFRPVHGFHLLDDRMVLIDMISTSVVARSREDLRIYRAAFDHFRARATTEIDPILDRYVVRYADQARVEAQRDSARG
jgi:hypothetical protein